MPPFHPARMVLTVTRDREGRLVIASPYLPGWATACRTPGGLARALEEAWREHDVRAYANSHGEEYDLAGLAADPEPDGTWHRLADGLWLSPSGRRYGEHTAMVQRVIANLQETM